MYRTSLKLLLCAALLAPGALLAETAPRLIQQAEEYALAGDFNAALPLYEKAIATLAPQPREQQQLRYRYGMVLNALGGQARPDLYPLARAQFEAVLDYIEEGATLEHSAARVRSALAHTYHQQAASEEMPAKALLLRNAYSLYSNAAQDLAQERQWHNLAITYFNLGQVCEWQGNLEEAIDWLEKAVALDARHGFADLEEDRQYLAALRRQANPTSVFDTTAL